MATKKDCSLADTTELRKLILENPDLPLVVFCGEESWSGDYNYSQAYVGKVKIQEMTLYNEKWLEIDDYEEELGEDLCDEYEDIDKEELKKMIQDKVAETEFVEAIVVYVG